MLWFVWTLAAVRWVQCVRNNGWTFDRGRRAVRGAQRRWRPSMWLAPTVWCRCSRRRGRCPATYCRKPLPQTASRASSSAPSSTHLITTPCGTVSHNTTSRACNTASVHTQTTNTTAIRSRHELLKPTSRAFQPNSPSSYHSILQQALVSRTCDKSQQLLTGECVIIMYLLRMS